ncbi:hypothetical protein F5B18DRAFT_664214 [Nemania serpens]|nr:hypothetical protein F5B18DRAFT_664214 [Nemania serpens]
MVQATLHYLKALEIYETETPYFLNILNDDPAQQVLRTNLEYAPHDDISIEDIREKGGLDAFSIEENGFEVLKYTAKAAVDENDAEVAAYCEEIVKLVSEKLNAVHTICYDYRIRRNKKGAVDYEKDQDQGRTIAAPPVYPAHIDHTVEGGPKRTRRHLTVDEAATYLSDNYRSRIINVWRPLSHPVEDCPLAICEARSVDAGDLVVADRVTPNFRVELYYLQHNPNQKWYWISRQSPDELWLFTNYDSRCQKDGSRWGTCPHAAFINRDAKDHAPARSSIEVRLVVFNAVDGSS